MSKLFFGMLAATLLLSSGVAEAGCFGTAALSTCYDGSGNSYTVNRLGNSTYVNGYNAQTGSSWSQNSQTYGNTTYTNGVTNGNSWNSTQTNYGNGFKSIYGTNSAGQSFSYSCSAYGGCN